MFCITRPRALRGALSVRTLAHASKGARGFLFAHGVFRGIAWRAHASARPLCCGAPLGYNLWLSCGAPLWVQTVVVLWRLVWVRIVVVFSCQLVFFPNQALLRRVLPQCTKGRALSTAPPSLPFPQFPRNPKFKKCRNPKFQKSQIPEIHKYGRGCEGVQRFIN